MPPCFCSFNPPSTSISKFISDQPLLSMLETSCHTIRDFKKIHAHLVKTGLARDTVAASRALAFLAASPDLGYAHSLFRALRKQNLFTWNTMIRGFCQSPDPIVAIELFVEMLLTSPVRPERRTYPSVFKAYTRAGLVRDGAQLHGRIAKLGLGSDPFVRNSIIHMYSSCGLFVSARKLFCEEEEEDVVAWNSMIMGLSAHGEVDESRRLFVKTPSRNEASWSSMISGYVRNGMWIEALDLFGEMIQDRKIRPSEFALVSALNACSNVGALEQGKWIHGYINSNGVQLNVIVVTAIINMYCKCGDVETGRRVFVTAPRKGLSIWNSMMMGLATNGFENEAFALFLELESLNLEPDSVSFVGVLTACNHSLRVDKAKEYFKMMTERYGIEPSIQHYGCMVDALGRAGLIEEVVEVIRTMPMDPDGVIWGSLLSASGNCGEIAVAEWAAMNLISLDPEDTSAHVLMSNAYAGSSDFERAVEERVRMAQKTMKKQPGCSLIEVNGEVHEFVAGGKWHSM